MKSGSYGCLMLAGIAMIIGICLKVEANLAKNRPNLLLIVADDLGYTDLASYGNPIVETPALDSLADEGVRFTQAYASCTVCSPTRAALLTGMHPVDLNITDWIPGHQPERGVRPNEQFIVPNINLHLPFATVTLAEILKQRGYRTASIGKWHLGGDGSLPTEHGFDINVGGNEKGLPPSYYHPYTSDRFNFDLENLAYKDDGKYLTDRITDEAVTWISDQDEETPFFLYLPFYTVHTPIEGRKDLVEYYQKKGTTLESGIQLNPEFLAMVHCLDRSVGRVIRALEENRLRDNTLIIFVSDNGGLFSRNGNRNNISYNEPLRKGKGTHYEGGLRVPTIFNWPKYIPGDTVINTPVISTDVFPTILDAFSIADSIPNKQDGISLWPMLTHGADLSEREFVWHYPHYHKTTPGSVIRSGDYKLIKFYEGGRLELYNLAIDPGEKTDLSQTMPERVAMLHARLMKWLAEHDARFPSVNPAWIGERQ